MNRSGSDVQILQMYSLRCEPAQCFETTRKVVRIQEVLEMAAQLFVVVVVIPFDCRILDGAVHPLNLTVGPWMVRFCQSVFNLIRRTDHVERHRPRIGFVSGLFRELDAIVSEDGVDFVWNGFQQVFKELPRCFAISLLNQLSHGELADAINSYKEMQLSLFGSDLRDINVEITNRVALKLLPLRFVACDIWKTLNAMPLKTTMQRRAGQVRDGPL